MATHNGLLSILKPLAKAVLTNAVDAPRHVPMIWGPPGGGKSALGANLAAACSEDLQAEVIFTSCCLPNLDPMDGKGLLDVSGENTVWRRPDETVLPPCDTKYRIHLLDELPSAPHAVQAVFAQLMLGTYTPDGRIERGIGKHLLGPNTFLMAAGNRTSDRAGAVRMLSHVANRCIHFTFDMNVDESLAYMATRGHPPVLISFLSQRQDLLFNENFAKSEDPAFATARTWDEVGRIVKHVPFQFCAEAIAGCVGSGPAAEFMAFATMAAQLPDYATLRAMQPEDAAKVIEKAAGSVQYAAVSIIAANNKTSTDVDWHVETLEKVSPELVVACNGMMSNVYGKGKLVMLSKKALKYANTTSRDMFKS